MGDEDGPARYYDGDGTELLYAEEVAALISVKPRTVTLYLSVANRARAEGRAKAHHLPAPARQVKRRHVTSRAVMAAPAWLWRRDVIEEWMRVNGRMLPEDAGVAGG